VGQAYNGERTNDQGSARERMTQGFLLTLNSSITVRWLEVTPTDG
jgi:hypothetical protein